MKLKLEMISQIVKIERQLASTKFVKSGCIYLRDDIVEDICSDIGTITPSPLDSSILERFKLGPLVSSGLWRGKRADMQMIRGPCEYLILCNLAFSDGTQIMDIMSFVEAMA